MMTLRGVGYSQCWFFVAQKQRGIGARDNRACHQWGSGGFSFFYQSIHAGVWFYSMYHIYWPLRGRFDKALIWGTRVNVYVLVLELWIAIQAVREAMA